MSKVGTVIFQGKNYAEGVIQTRTLGLNIKLERKKTKQSDKHPDYIVFEKLSEGIFCQIGNGWDRVSDNGPGEGQKYMSLSLDDPSFPATLNVHLFSTDQKDEWDVVWNRPKGKTT